MNSGRCFHTAKRSSQSATPVISQDGTIYVATNCFHTAKRSSQSATPGCRAAPRSSCPFRFHTAKRSSQSATRWEMEKQEGQKKENVSIPLSGLHSLQQKWGDGRVRVRVFLVSIPLSGLHSLQPWPRKTHSILTPKGRFR